MKGFNYVSFSPNDKTVLIIPQISEPPPVIYVYDLENYKVSQRILISAFPNNVSTGGVVWSPNGEQFAIVTASGGDFELYEQDAEWKEPLWSVLIIDLNTFSQKIIIAESKKSISLLEITNEEILLLNFNEYKSDGMGRLGSVIAKAISNAEDMQLSGVYSPSHKGKVFEGVTVQDSIEHINADVIVECTHPNVVMENLKQWHDKGVHVVVGTSGFTSERIEEVKSFWGESDNGCLIVPNFSIGAVLMMRFAEIASAYFESAEIIERHENTKPDAPSGTALATAMRMGKHRKETEDKSNEIIKGARGGLASGIRVHSLRMKGLLSDQEVAFSNLGETFSINHRSTSYESFANGALVAIRYVQSLKGVAVGLDSALDFE